MLQYRLLKKSFDIHEMSLPIYLYKNVIYVVTYSCITKCWAKASLDLGFLPLSHQLAPARH